MVDVPKRFRDNLRKQLAEAKMNQKQLSEKSGITESAVSRYINGSREPTLRMLYQIKAGLGCSWEELMD